MIFGDVATPTVVAEHAEAATTIAVPVKAVSRYFPLMAAKSKARSLYGEIEHLNTR